MEHIVLVIEVTQEQYVTLADISDRHLLTLQAMTDFKDQYLTLTLKKTLVGGGPSDE